MCSGPQTSQYILILLMFCGACAGSTGGGVKCSRMLILLRTIRREIHQIAHPRSVEVVRLEGKVVDENTLRSVLTFIGCYVLILLGAGLIVSLDDVSFSVSFSAALTCLSNVGPGLQEIGPVGSFAEFSPPVQGGAVGDHDRRPFGALPHSGAVQPPDLEPQLTPAHLRAPPQIQRRGAFFGLFNATK